MEVMSITGDMVLLLHHPDECVDVGEQLLLLERPEEASGLVVQVIGLESLEYQGLEEELLQRVLESRVEREVPLDGEGGIGEIRSLKVARAKIRKRVQGGKWKAWDGWIPSRNVRVERLGASDLVDHVLPTSRLPLGAFVRLAGAPIELEGPRLNMVNVVAGVKGSGKSHLAKHLLLSMAEKKVPVICFDLNGEYVELPSVQVLRWGRDLSPAPTRRRLRDARDGGEDRVSARPGLALGGGLRDQAPRHLQPQKRAGEAERCAARRRHPVSQEPGLGWR
jgi:uncharacterized protein